MLMRVFGAPFCAPCFEDETPTKVLELCCGSALWSSACNDYFKRSGSKVSFTGLDIAPLAPDLNRSGLDWTFVQHDTRKRLPFPDEEFDFIFIKDASICTSASVFQADPLGEPLRLLRSGGVLEVWDSDYLLRTLLPNPPVARGTSEDDLEQAQATGTYTISAATPFAQAQNQYLKDYNSWAQKALEKCRITTTPCASISLAFSAEADSFQDYGSRRIAIPLSEVRWEREPGATLATSKRRVSTPGTGEYRKLSQDQLALRRTALMTVVQTIESLEPMLIEANGYGQDEWDRWWSNMTADLLQQKGTANGEVLEVGAWWGQKR
ncbi:putative sam binding domain-containing protein containing protein [Phaeomoniella chlamydospora]|uniref:Putative sam binding domain-containing protein containing protein n=1 Tax=Phaeomoniella chlamydospora TaxID=158046 RepID=A0A0G2DRS8_PHACM|nr:putative sam binding domain-containing protein containing protein [Phaeomoniella chlamydospora]